jgi:endonuclease/exonuclease/phosphatase (EEP) superfamily protein YafD
VRDGGTGLMLWSRIPLVNSQIRYLVSNSRPSIFAQVKLDDYGVLNYVGLHPLPPGLPVDDDAGRHDSRIRDAELMLVAEMVADQPDATWIVSGDFNDVAWSHTTQMFQRLSGLKDPKVGRGFYNTYHAMYPWLRFPIDQVFISSNGSIAEMGRFHPAGSDHFAITAAIKFAHQPMAYPTASSADMRQAEEMIEAGREDAHQHK